MIEGNLPQGRQQNSLRQLPAFLTATAIFVSSFANADMVAAAKEPSKTKKETSKASRTAYWVLDLAPLLGRYRGDIPLDFLLGWIGVESGGHIDTLTELGKRGYFQLSPGESKMLEISHTRLSTDRDYSIQAGISLVREYGNLAAREGFAPGTDLYWHVLKFNHSMGGAVAVVALLDDMKSHGIQPSTWEAIRSYSKSNQKRLLKALKHDPVKWVGNVDRVFVEGAALAVLVPASSVGSASPSLPATPKVSTSPTPSPVVTSPPPASPSPSATASQSQAPPSPTPTPVPICKRSTLELKQDRNVLTTNGTEPVQVVFRSSLSNLVPSDATPTLCWLTKSQEDAKTLCDKVRVASAEVAGFSAGYCKDDAFFALDQGATSVEFVKAKLIVLGYDPQGRSPRIDKATLKVEWTTPTPSPAAAEGKKDTTDSPENPPKGPTPAPTTTPVAPEPTYQAFHVIGSAEPPEDPRYRLTLYGGVNYLYSHNNFSETFPELRLLVESRLLECIEARKIKGKCEWWSDSPWNPSLRVYGDFGLSSTASSVSPQANSSSQFQGSKVFDGMGGIGLGFVREVAARAATGLTRSFSYRFVARIGVASLEKASSTDGSVPFKSFYGLRVENESGRYKGAYAEFGFGRSDQFIYQTSTRLKADLLAPFIEPGAYRLAGRLQIDVPSPFRAPNERISCPGGTVGCETDPNLRDAFHNLPYYSPATSRSLARAGEIKISLFFEVDILELFKRLGAPTSANSNGSQ